MARLMTTTSADRRVRRELPWLEAVRAIVVTVLVGLVGMHGLSPTAGSASTAVPAVASSSVGTCRAPGV
ncbi:MAG TPA: hypothetical protein VI076_16225 [Actinopolymorphaceae bacterium]